MRVFVTGATGALGRHLVPGLVAAGHQVTATTRSAAKTGQLREAGATPVVVDGLDRSAVIAAVRAAAPEVIVHQMTALADMRSLRQFDRVFAATNELRTRGTDNLLAAARRPDPAGGGAELHRLDERAFRRAGEDGSDPLDPHPLPSTRQSMAAIRHVEQVVPAGCRRAWCCATAASTARERRMSCSTWSVSGSCR